MNKFIVKILIWINSFSYRLIGIFVIKENKGIHPKHKILNYHDFFIKNITENDSVLDIGCGNGACTWSISQKAKKVVGIDMSVKNINLAKKKFSNDNLEFIVGDAVSYKFMEKFDVIVLSNVLEHIEKRVEFLKKIKRLAPKILIRVPLVTRDWLSVYKKEKGFEYRLDKTHYIEYTEENFGKEMKVAGLEIEKQYVKFGELYSVVRID